MKQSYSLSKSRYVRGRQCLKSLWLYKHNPELQDPISDFQEGIFEQGHEVGELAHDLFPGGVLIEADHTQPELALEQTSLAISSGAKVLYEGAFLHDDVLIRADIMVFEGGKWHLYEVKSASSVRKELKNSNPLKPQYIQDIALQKWVLLGAGVELGACHLVSLNKNYVRKGAINVAELFVVQDVSMEIEGELDRVPAFVTAFKQSMRGSMPNQEIGSHCKNPYVCSFFGHCWSGVDGESVNSLSRLSESKRRELIDSGIEKIEEIPEDFDLTEKQRIQVAVANSDKPHINKKYIKKFVDSFEGPLYYLDFETIGYAIPRYDGTSPYKPLIFQYSLHIDVPDGMIHKEFFWEEDSDPSRAVAESLIRDLGDLGSIVTYHQSFEETQIKNLIKRCPDLEEPLQKIILRLVDLELPFAKFEYCDKRFDGRSSIKKVLPVLVPELSYGDLEVQKGDQAQRVYLEFLGIRESAKDREALKQGLLEYCKLDTFAMVEIYRVLKETVGEK